MQAFCCLILKSWKTDDYLFFLLKILIILLRKYHKSFESLGDKLKLIVS